MSNKILITGAAGFIGFHICSRLIEEGLEIIGYDNVNRYYDIGIKENRLFELEKKGKKKKNWKFIKGNLENNDLLNEIFEKFNPKVVIHLAAQAGVRYSITNPKSYIDSNLIGFMNILEACKKYHVKKILYASN